MESKLLYTRNVFPSVPDGNTNLAIGLAFLFAIYIKNGPMLFILILVRLITDLIDAPAFQIFREPPLVAQMIIFTLLCYLPAFYGLRYLWKEMRND